MPDDQHPKQIKPNEINGLPRCPHGSDVGIFGKANGFVDGMTAGLIYGSAIMELVEQTEEIDRALATLTEEEKTELLPDLEEDLRQIDKKWLLATAMFGINA